MLTAGETLHMQSIKIKKGTGWWSFENTNVLVLIEIKINQIVDKKNDKIFYP